MQIETPSSSSLPYAQTTLCKHTFDDYCQQFYQTYVYEKRLLIKTKQQMLKFITLEDIKPKKLQSTKEVKLRKNIKKFEEKGNFKSLTFKLKKIALGLGNLIKPAILAEYLGISIGRAKYLQKQVLQQPDFPRQELAFSFDAQHKLWIEKFVAQDNVAHLNSAKQIYQKFIANFHICIQGRNLKVARGWQKKEQFSIITIKSSSSKVNLFLELQLGTDLLLTNVLWKCQSIGLWRIFE